MSVVVVGTIGSSWCGTSGLGLYGELTQQHQQA